MEEREPVQRCVRGEPRAWERLVDEYGGAVLDAARFTLRRVLGAVRDEDADNVVQAVFVALCDKNAHRLKLFQGRSSLRTWLASIAINCAREALRRRRPGTEGEPAFLDPPASPPSPPGEIESLVRRLPDGYREVLVLHDVEGYTHEEIGTLLGIETGTSKSQLSRARRELRKALERGEA